MSKLKKVRIIRSKRRVGSIQARSLAMVEARAPTLTVLDSHCECFPGKYATVPCRNCIVFNYCKTVILTRKYCIGKKIDLHPIKDLNSTVAKRGSVFIGLMTSDGAIWFRYQRAVLMW